MALSPYARLRCLVLLLLPLACAHSAGMGMKGIATPAEPNAIPLHTGGVPGAIAPESWFRWGDEVSVRNVQRATLTPFLPDKAKATGAAVIVAPGGGFLFLSMQNEGWPVARWLADHGIAAFVLKYRLTPSAPSLPDFEAEAGRLFDEEVRTQITVAQTTHES